MNYNFPKITHIDQVLPAIMGSPEFIVVEKDGYQVINYVVMTGDTFPDVTDEHSMLRRECRGLIFDLEGKLINRRYHKFFNVNEREETLEHNIDWSASHMLLEKLDGSMVSPCPVMGHIRWMTKMGVTDTSMQAEVFVVNHPEYYYFAKAMLEKNFTPIFEWCSNKNRIVLDYPEDRFVLTAMRDTFTGEYASYGHLKAVAKLYDIEVVGSYAPTDKNLLDVVGNWEDAEGVVVRFDNGHMAKVKCGWYVRIHKVKSLLGSERDVVKLILNNELDDLLSVLPREDVEKIESFRDEMTDLLSGYAFALATQIEMLRSMMTRKEFALKNVDMDPLMRSIVFKFWDKEVNESLTYATIVAIILHNCGNNGNYAKVKEAFLRGVEYV